MSVITHTVCPGLPVMRRPDSSAQNCPPSARRRRYMPFTGLPDSSASAWSARKQPGLGLADEMLVEPSAGKVLQAVAQQFAQPHVAFGDLTVIEHGDATRRGIEDRLLFGQQDVRFGAVPQDPRR